MDCVITFAFDNNCQASFWTVFSLCAYCTPGSILSVTPISNGFIIGLKMKLLFNALIVFIIIGFASTERNGCGVNEIFNQCGSPCNRTCEDPIPTCIEKCEVRCECKPGFVVDSKTKKCIDIKQCENKQY